MIFIKDIDEDNEQLVRNIKIKPNQIGFIESVEECLEEAKLNNQWHPVAIYNKNKLIGFAMYGSFGSNKNTWIDRIIIDARYQGNGFGRSAMVKLIDIVSKKFEVEELYLSIVEENKVAYELYKSLGFEYINERDDQGELIFKYEIKE